MEGPRRSISVSMDQAAEKEIESSGDIRDRRYSQNCTGPIDGRVTLERILLRM